MIVEVTLLNNKWLVSLLNCVPCMLKTCSRVNVPCVLTCHACLRANVLGVLSCSRALSAFVPHVSKCLECLCTHISMWLAISRAHAPTCLSPMPRTACMTCQRALPPQ